MSHAVFACLLAAITTASITHGQQQHNPCAGTGSGPLAVRLEANIHANDANRDWVVSGSEITSDLTNNYDKDGDGCVTLQEWIDVWKGFKFSPEYATARIKDLGVDVTSTCPIKVDAFSAVSIPMTTFINANIDSLVKLCEGNTTLYETVCDCWELKHELCVRDPSFQTYATCQKYVSTVIVGR
ncbi:unnamed protein product [Lymnaea stagnalis]|uniref:EF-hand domain-containing protein n=1 Tax=Lymnaea stagnalis TaxID=6523 RepID=A0AAV2HWC3_LYMST